jgi:hypothetical protein
MGCFRGVGGAGLPCEYAKDAPTPESTHQSVTAFQDTYCDMRGLCDLMLKSPFESSYLLSLRQINIIYVIASQLWASAHPREIGAPLRKPYRNGKTGRLSATCSSQQLGATPIEESRQQNQCDPRGGFDPSMLNTALEAGRKRPSQEQILGMQWLARSDRAQQPAQRCSVHLHQNSQTQSIFQLRRKPYE